MTKLLHGYRLKSLKSCSDYYWVDGGCGFLVATGSSPEEATLNAIEKIQKEKTRLSNPESLGKASWMY